MKSKETLSNAKGSETRAVRHRYTSVRDSRNRKIRGLWIRNDAYYVQFWVAGERSPRRSRLGAKTLEAAKREMASVLQKRHDGDLPDRRAKPFFDEFAEEYITFLTTASDMQRRPGSFYKSSATVRKERGNLQKWIAHFGRTRVDHITRAMVTSFLEKRLAEGNSPRTVNLDAIILRNVLKRALDAGHIRALPTLGIKPLKSVSPRRKLLTPSELTKLFDAAKMAGRNGTQLHQFLRLLAYTGSREQDALRLRWDAVNLAEETLSIFSSKNRATQTIEFNAELRTLIKEMATRRFPDSVYLFPTPRRGGKDGHITNFRGAFNTARRAAGLPTAGFHDLRHYFASMAVMSGVDFMTVSNWLGHKDGGTLVGKVYGHLLDEHRRRAANKLDFGLSSLVEGRAEGLTTFA